MGEDVKWTAHRCRRWPEEASERIATLTRELTDPQIEAILQANLPLDETCTQLIKAANKAGGHDNITCLLVKVD